MDLQSQVTSLELSKKLRELGVKQESCFWWCDPSDGDKADVGFIRDNHVGYKVYYSAFTVAELGEMLPASIDGFETYAGLSIEKTDGNFWTVAYENFAYKVHLEKSSHSLADAMAFTLIYLLENKLITL